MKTQQTAHFYIIPQNLRINFEKPSGGME